MDALRRFLQLESAGGLVLMAAAALAILSANTGLSHVYEDLLAVPLVVTMGGWGVDKPFGLWVNDGLMAVFFLLVGLELKREFLLGELRGRERIWLPGLAALAGMVVPAAIYALVNWGDRAALAGWAIPTATDIAFALGVLALLGPRVPHAVKVLLTAIAIFDDLGAIIIIALFYTAQLSLGMLAAAGVAAVALAALNRAGVTRLAPYLWIGALLWLFLLKSGIHATLAGVLVAMAIPVRGKGGETPLEALEHALHPWVAFLVLPVFGFCNAGVDFTGMGLGTLFQPVTLGTALGLVVGKPLGVMAALWLGIRVLRLAPLPEGTDWRHLAGLSCLAGVGFTMSLFIGMLAFDAATATQGVRLGVLLGSGLAALAGWLILRLPRPSPCRS